MHARSSVRALAIAWLLLAAPALAKQAMQAGRWQVSVDMSAPGTGLSLPSSEQVECLSQAEVDADPLPELEKGACKATHVERSGDTIRWELDCGGLGKGRGEVTYRSATRYDGWMTLDVNGTPVRATIQARRVGDC